MGPSAGANLAGVVFVVVFSLPFIGVGAFVLLDAAGLADGGISEQSPAFAVVLGTVFMTAGGGLAAAAIFGGLRVHREHGLRARYPTEPWRWREDWAQGMASESGGASAVAALIVAMCWNFVSLGAVILGARKIRDEEQWVAGLIVMLFVGVGLWLAYRAALALLRQARFGSARLETDGFPVRRGGELVGVAQVRGRVENHVRAQLVCQRLVTSGSGDNRHTDVTDLAATSITVATTDILAGPQVTRIPIRIQVERQAPDTSNEGGNVEIRWTLRLRSDLNGPDLAADLEVPVFGEAAG